MEEMTKEIEQLKNTVDQLQSIKVNLEMSNKDLQEQLESAEAEKAKLEREVSTRDMQLSSEHEKTQQANASLAFAMEQSNMQ